MLKCNAARATEQQLIVVMHFRIYLWLSCVVLAGYVRATEDGVASESPTEETVHIQNDGQIPSDRDLFIDNDEGSGVDTDESSGSGWGAGPGPDDEDSRGGGGSGDGPHIPEDDEDYKAIDNHSTTQAADTGRKFDTDYDDFSELPDSPQTPEVPVVPETPNTTLSPANEPPIPDPDVAVPVDRPKSIEGAVDTRSGAGEEKPSRPELTDINISGEDTNPSTDQDQSGTNVDTESRPPDNVVFIMNAKPEDRAISFFAQPGILAAVIGGAVVGLLCAILVVMFIVYRMRKKDEGSYALDEPKRSPAAASYGKGHNNREFYA